MTKAIVFDLDNTLLTWESEYDKYARQTLRDYGFPDDDYTYNEFQKAMGKYEDTHIKFDYVEMSRFYKDFMKLDIPDDFIEHWSFILRDAYPKEVDPELIKLLDYLSKKYDLYVTTNWYQDQQRIRLENCGIAHYFKGIYGCDKYDKKPYTEMMELLDDKYKREEIVYVGDKYSVDVKFALNCNVYCYYLTTTDKRRSNKYKVIKSIYDLYKYL